MFIKQTGLFFGIILSLFIVPAISNNHHEHGKSNQHHQLKKNRNHFGHLSLVRHHHHLASRNGNNSAQFIIFWNQDVLGAINIENNASGTIDTKNKINIITTTNKAFAIDFNTKLGYKLDRIPSLDELKNPQELLNGAKNKQGFNISDNEEFSAELTILEKALVLNYVPSKDNVKSHVDLIENIISLNNGSAKGFFSGSGSIKTSHDYVWVLQVQSALAVLLENSSGGLEELIKQGVQLNLTEILSQQSGTEAVVVLLKEIGDKVDLSKVLGTGWDVVLKILKAIQEFKGTEGLDGLFNIIGHIVDTIHGNGSIDSFIETILTIVRNRRPIVIKPEEIKSIIDNLLSLADNQNKLFKNAQAFEVLLKLLRDLNDNNLILENINITAVLNIFTTGDFSNGIQVVIQIFTRIGSMPQNAPRIFASLLRLAQVDLQLMIQAGIHLPAELQQNLSNISNIRDLLSHFHLPGNLDFPAALEHLPVIGDIFKAFNGSLDLNSLFNSSLVQDQLKNITANLPGPFGQIFGGFLNQIAGIGQQIVAGISGGFNGSENIISNIENGAQGIFGGLSSANNSNTPPPTENRQKNYGHSQRSKHFRLHHEKELEKH